MDDFQYAESLRNVEALLDAFPDPIEKGVIRRVRTVSGMKVFKRPIGTIITRRMYEEAVREGRIGGDNGGARGGGGRGGSGGRVGAAATGPSRPRGGGGAGGGRPGGRKKAGGGRGGARGAAAAPKAPAGRGNAGGRAQKPSPAKAQAPLSPKAQKHAKQIDNKLAPKNVEAVAERIRADVSLTEDEKTRLLALADKKHRDLGGKGVPGAPAPVKAAPPKKAVPKKKQPAAPPNDPPAARADRGKAKLGPEARRALGEKVTDVPDDTDDDTPPAKERVEQRPEPKKAPPKPSTAAQERAKAREASDKAREASDKAREAAEAREKTPAKAPVAASGMKKVVERHPVLQKVVDKAGAQTAKKIAEERAAKIREQQKKDMLNVAPASAEEEPDHLGTVSPQMQRAMDKIKNAKNRGDIQAAIWDVYDAQPSEREDEYANWLMLQAEKRLGLAPEEDWDSDTKNLKKYSALIEQSRSPFQIRSLVDSFWGEHMNDRSYEGKDVNFADFDKITRLAYEREKYLRDSGELWEDMTPDIKVDPDAVKPPVGEPLSAEGFKALFQPKKGNNAPANVREMLADEEGRTTYGALAKGAKVGDMLDKTDLWAAITMVATKRVDLRHGTRGPRFEITEPEEGQGGAYLVKDLLHNEDFFFKQANNGFSKKNTVMFSGDSAAEVVAGKFGHQALPDIFLDTDYASPPSDRQPMIQMQHIATLGENFQTDAFDRWGPGLDGDVVVDPRAAKVDPKSAMALHIFDFLTNQTDRHPGNYGTVYDEDGNARLVAFDNGAAFFSFNEYPLAIDGYDVPDRLIYEPEAVGYEEWAKYYAARKTFTAKGQYLAMEVEAAYDYGGNNEQMTKDAQEVIDKFKSVDLDSMLADLFERFPNMDEHESAHIYANIRTLKSRIQNIEAQQVTNIINSMRDESGKIR